MVLLRLLSFPIHVRTLFSLREYIGGEEVTPGMYFAANNVIFLFCFSIIYFVYEYEYYLWARKHAHARDFVFCAFYFLSYT